MNHVEVVRVARQRFRNLGQTVAIGVENQHINGPLAATLADDILEQRFPVVDSGIDDDEFASSPVLHNGGDRLDDDLGRVVRVVGRRKGERAREFTG